MKTICLLSLVVLFSFGTLLGGGVVSNTNQSAAFMRTLNRNASLDVDAAYYNPAGLTKLCDGIYVDIANQSIWQTKTINNDLVSLNKDEFVGDVAAPVFPTAHLVWKKSRLAVAASVMPIGGGGSADYTKGLPSFEMEVSGLKVAPALIAQGVNAYKLDVNFKGSSIYLGAQGGAAFKVNEMISVFGGVRYIMANNTYEGYLKNIQINPGGNWIKANTFFTNLASLASGGADSVQKIITAGGGSYTLAQLRAAQMISPTDSATIAGGLVQFGVSENQIALMNVSSIQATYTGISNDMTRRANDVADKKVDAKRAGYGIAGIIGVNLTPMKGLNIGLRYETIAKMEMENETKKDDTGLFPDGVKYGSDMPSQLAVGIGYTMGKLRVMSDINYYDNGSADWDSAEVNFDNGFEAGVGVEYALTKSLKVSGGYLYSKQGAKEAAQSDMDFNLDTNTLGAGLIYTVKPGIDVNFGVLNTFYKEASKKFIPENIPVSVNEKYNQSTIGFAFGLQVKL